MNENLRISKLKLSNYRNYKSLQIIPKKNNIMKDIYEYIDRNVEINDTGRAIKGTINALKFPKNK